MGTVLPISVIGDDGEGYELRQALARLRAVGPDAVFAATDRRTPTYTKPMLSVPGEAPRELNRLDIKNRTALPPAAETAVLRALDAVWPEVDALLVLDQVSEADCGVVTGRVRDRLARLGAASPERLVIVDSRERVGMFSNVRLKPNERECRKAEGSAGDLSAAVRLLALKCGRPVFCTISEQGMLVADPTEDAVRPVPAYAVAGPIDPVGAGDSSSAALACALAAGASALEAAAFANLVASITIQQIGTTGTARPEQVLGRWREVQSAR